MDKCGSECCEDDDCPCSKVCSDEKFCEVHEYQEAEAHLGKENAKRFRAARSPEGA